MSGEVRMVPISDEEAATLREHAANLEGQRIRFGGGARPPGPGEALIAALVDRYEQAEEAPGALEALARALDGCLWVLDNRHNAGTSAFDQYAEAAEADAHDARRLYAGTLKRKGERG